MLVVIVKKWQRRTEKRAMWKDEIRTFPEARWRILQHQIKREREGERQGWRALGKKVRCNRIDIYNPGSEVSVFPSRKS